MDNNEGYIVHVAGRGFGKQDAINAAYRELEAEAKRLNCILPTPYQPENYVAYQPAQAWQPLWYGNNISVKTPMETPINIPYTYQSTNTAGPLFPQEYPVMNMILRKDYAQDTLTYEVEDSSYPGDNKFQIKAVCNCGACTALRKSRYRPFQTTAAEAQKKQEELLASFEWEIHDQSISEIVKAFGVTPAQIGIMTDKRTIMKDEATDITLPDALDKGIEILKEMAAYPDDMSLADARAYLSGEYSKIQGVKTPMYQYLNPNAPYNTDQSNDPNDKGGDTQPLAPKQTALALLEQGKSCTDGVYTIIVSDLNTFRVMQEADWYQVFCAAKTDLKDRIAELREFRNEIEDPMNRQYVLPPLQLTEPIWEPYE